MDPTNLYEVYTLYYEYIFSTCPQPQALATWNTFKTALLRFLLQEFNFEREDPLKKMTKVEVEAAEEYLKTLSMRSLLRVRTAMSDSLIQLKASQSSRNTYTSRINQFLNWGEQQAWWPDNLGENGRFRDQCCPPRQTKGKVQPLKLVPGKGKAQIYSLKEQQLPQQLRSQFRAMIKFLTEPNNPERTFRWIEESTAKGYCREILLLLGWFHKFHNPSVPLEELSFDLIFPVFDEEFLDKMSEREQEKFWRQQKVNFKRWLCDYRTFLQQVQKSYSPSTWLCKLEAVFTIARYQWSSHVEYEEDYLQIPLMRQLRQELKDTQQERSDWVVSGRYVADQTQKWPDVPEGKSALEVIQETVLEGLRLKCHPRTALHANIRTPQALANCHQHLLMWTLHAFIPAHRQEVARTEQVALSCPIEKPSTVPSNGLYQPLPPDVVLPKRQNGTVEANFLTRLYAYKGVEYPEGVWIRIIRDYKTWKTHGDQEYVIPNWTFSDGSHLYDYIERYLYGFWLPGSFKGSQTYTWWQPELKDQRGMWFSSGRADLIPIDCCSIDSSEQTQWIWGSLFVLPRSGLPFDDARFSKCFAYGSLTTIKKWITPHILRSVWATWGYEQGLSEAELRSLAYSMGMTLATLRKIYERCTPQEKRRAIEQLLSEQLPNAGNEERISIEKLIRFARKLNLTDRQKLISALLDSSS